MLFNAGAYGAGPDLFFLKTSDNNICWNTWDSAANPFLGGGGFPASITNGGWHHYAVVNDQAANNTKLYIDGALYGTAAYRAAGTAFTIGSAGLGDANFGWKGKIDDIQIYNTALSQAEIQALFKDQGVITADPNISCVKQSFVTTIGQQYWLSLAVIGYGGGGTVRATVFEPGNTNLVADFAAPGGNLWGTNNFEFVATSSFSTIQIQNVAGNCTIDDVRVTRDPTDVVVIAPGNTAGSLTIDGSLNLLASANLSFDIGGLTQGSTYDLVKVTSFVQFVGTLSLSLINNFLPSSTDSFTLMEFASLLGTFDNAANGSRLNTSDNLASFEVTYTGTNLVTSAYLVLCQS